MEQLVPISKNIAGNNKLSEGSLMLFEKLKSIKDNERIFIEAAFPNLQLKLEWSEFPMPNIQRDAFEPMLSPILSGYKFQYFAKFFLDQNSLESPDFGIAQHSEIYEVKMNDKILYQSNSNNNGLVNCTWLIDFIMNSKNIEKDSLRNENLIWIQRENCFEIILESNNTKDKIKERQIISFQNNFKSYFWKHVVSLF
jgi:hypothetical protein